MPTKKTDRLEWLDATRGVGIILVAFCHIYFEYTRIYIYSFLIPLFFIISGMLYKKEKHNSTLKFASHRAKSQLYPYVLWSFILFSFWAIADAGQLPICNGFLGIFYGICDHKYLDWGMMMWFIPTLYVAEIIYDFVSRNIKLQHISILALTILGYLYSASIETKLPWGVNISLVMLLFFHIGQLSFKYINKCNKTKALIAFPILLIIYYTTSQLNGYIFSESGIFQNPLLYIVSGTSGTFMIISAFKIVRVKVLETVGSATLIIMILHLRTFTFFKVVEKYVLKIEHKDNLVSAVIFTILAIAILTPVAKIINTKYRFLTYPIKRKNSQ